GQEGGRQPTGPDGHWLEPLTVLSMVAAVTSRVRLATGILIAALRRPVVLAKTTATLDVLSGGRLDLGVGVGWQREEYEAAGLDFHDRGRLLDHTLAVCQTLWRGSRRRERHPAGARGAGCRGPEDRRLPGRRSPAQREDLERRRRRGPHHGAGASASGGRRDRLPHLPLAPGRQDGGHRPPRRA